MKVAKLLSLVMLLGVSLSHAARSAADVVMGNVEARDAETQQRKDDAWQAAGGKGPKRKAPAKKHSNNYRMTRANNNVPSKGHIKDSRTPVSTRPM